MLNYIDRLMDGDRRPSFEDEEANGVNLLLEYVWNRAETSP
jgi:hypothetical protein